jgi:hypothetical protein
MITEFDCVVAASTTVCSAVNHGDAYFAVLGSVALFVLLTVFVWKVVAGSINAVK